MTYRKPSGDSYETVCDVESNEYCSRVLRLPGSLMMVTSSLKIDSPGKGPQRCHKRFSNTVIIVKESWTLYLFQDYQNSLAFSDANLVCSIVIPTIKIKLAMNRFFLNAMRYL